MTTPGRAGYILTIGFCAGLLGEGLLFMHRQLGLVESVLADDFKVLALPADGRGGAELEKNLQALPGVQKVRRVSPDEALARLSERDPEAAQTLAKAPVLPDSYELTLSGEKLSSLTQWAAQARKSEPGAEFRYKPMQAAAILQVRFYERFLELCGALALAAWLAGGARLFWRGGGLRACAFALAGAAGGMALALALAFPLKAVSTLWAWPDMRLQLLVLAAGAAGGAWMGRHEN